MYQSDEDKGFVIPPPLLSRPNSPSLVTRLPTSSQRLSVNPSQFSISPDPNKLLPNLHSYLAPIHAPSPIINNNPILCTNNEANNEHEEEQEIRRLKRMISNRESARRSRMRKRKQLETLHSQVLQLLAANHQLAEKLNHVMETNYQILQENARLREESLSLRKNVADMLASMKSEFEDGACNVVHFRANSQTIISSAIASSVDVIT